MIAGQQATKTYIKDAVVYARPTKNFRFSYGGGKPLHLKRGYELAHTPDFQGAWGIETLAFHNTYTIKSVDENGVIECFKHATIQAFIAEEDGTLETLEGPSAFKVGDFIAIGSKGEMWVVGAKVREQYKEVADN